MASPVCSPAPPFKCMGSSSSADGYPEQIKGSSETWEAEAKTSAEGGIWKNMDMQACETQASYHPRHRPKAV